MTIDDELKQVSLEEGNRLKFLIETMEKKRKILTNDTYRVYTVEVDRFFKEHKNNGYHFQLLEKRYNKIRERYG